MIFSQGDGGGDVTLLRCCFLMRTIFITKNLRNRHQHAFHGMSAALLLHPCSSIPYANYSHKKTIASS